MASRKEVDPGWSYGTAIEGTKNSVLCNFCAFVSKGGITRHKHHLAGDSPDVSRCPKVPDDVKELFKQHFANKKKAKEMMTKVPHFDDVVNLEEEEKKKWRNSLVEFKQMERDPFHPLVHPSPRPVEHLHSKKRNRLEQKKLNDLVYIKYNRALRRRYDMRDTIDPIILDDTNVEDPKEWLRGSLGEEEEDEEDALVVEGEDLTWGDVAAASGAGEAAYSTRAGSRGSNRGDKTSTSKSSARGSKASSGSKERCLIDEDSDDFDEDAEENDVAAYKDYVPTLDGEDDDDDEAEFEDLDR